MFWVLCISSNCKHWLTLSFKGEEADCLCPEHTTAYNSLMVGLIAAGENKTKKTCVVISIPSNQMVAITASLQVADAKLSQMNV